MKKISVGRKSMYWHVFLGVLIITGTDLLQNGRASWDFDVSSATFIVWLYVCTTLLFGFSRALSFKKKLVEDKTTTGDWPWYLIGIISSVLFFSITAMLLYHIVRVVMIF